MRIFNFFFINLAKKKIMKYFIVSVKKKLFIYFLKFLFVFQNFIFLHKQLKFQNLKWTQKKQHYLILILANFCEHMANIWIPYKNCHIFGTIYTTRKQTIVNFRKYSNNEMKLSSNFNQKYIFHKN